MQIGVLAESFGLPLRQAIRAAARLGVRGIQIYAVEGETAPENMDAAAAAELRRQVHGEGLVISARRDTVKTPQQAPHQSVLMTLFNLVDWKNHFHIHVLLLL